MSGAFEVDLIDALSHQWLGESLEQLSARDWVATTRTQPPQKPKKQRPFAEIGDAVVQVLRDAGRELRMIEIHAAVEDVLGEGVSRSSVKNYLARGCQRKRTLVERVSRGRYRLL